MRISTIWNVVLGLIALAVVLALLNHYGLI